jgi:hypothetical protein
MLSMPLQRNRALQSKPWFPTAARFPDPLGSLVQLRRDFTEDQDSIKYPWTELVRFVSEMPVGLDSRRP